MISLFATIGAETGVIGLGGKTPFGFPEAYKQMHKICAGTAVILGRRTFEHLRREQQLPAATKMIVLSRTIPYNFSAMPEATVAASLERATKRTRREKRTVIIGGPEVYDEAIQIADRLVITKVCSSVRGDAFFPTISSDVWKRSGALQLSPGPGNPVPLEFAIYERRRS